MPLSPERPAPAPASAPDAARGGRLDAGAGGGAARPRVWLERLAAAAAVAAVVVLLARGTGGVAPAGEPGAADAVATRTAEARAGGATSVPTSGVPTADAGGAPGEEAAAGAGASPAAPGEGEPVAPAPLPPAGTRLYGSVAELAADPPPAGETVWVDAYHGEILEESLEWDRDAARPECPSPHQSVLLDVPFLHDVWAFDGMTSSIPDAHAGVSLLAAGLDAGGAVTPLPSLPRYGRLILRLGDPALARCDQAERIALVERVAHVFRAKPDWAALREAIRASETVGWLEGATIPSDAEGNPTEELGAYRIAVPAGLAVAETAVAETDADLVARLAQPDLPDHPILVRRYLPGMPGYEERLRRLADPRGWYASHVQRPSGPANEAAARDHRLTFAVLSSELDDVPPGGLDYLTPHVIRAIADASGTVYELEVTLPKDNVRAQPLLWRLEAVLDRFETPVAATGIAPSAAPPSPIGLDPTVVADVGFPATALAAVDGLAVVGGTGGLALLAIDPHGWATAQRPYHPPSPAALGLVVDADVERVARQVAGGDLAAARALLEGTGGSWAAGAVALRPPFAYAALEWPVGSGLAWLHVLDAGDRPAERLLVDPADVVAHVGAARLDAGAGAPFGSVRAHDMALAGDRLLVATGAGLFDVDVSVPAAPVVRLPAEGLQGVITAVAVAPDGRRAWACGGQLGAGAVTALDLTDPGALRVAGAYRAEHAILDCATDGRTLWATTGSETHDVVRFDVAGGGAPRLEGPLPPAGGAAVSAQLLGHRLVLGASDLEVSPSAYPGPIAPLAAGRHGLVAYFVVDPDTPALLGAIPLPDAVHDLATAGRFLLAAVGTRGVWIYAGAPDGG